MGCAACEKEPGAELGKYVQHVLERAGLRIYMVDPYRSFWQVARYIAYSKQPTSEPSRYSQNDVIQDPSTWLRAGGKREEDRGQDRANWIPTSPND